MLKKNNTSIGLEKPMWNAVRVLQKMNTRHSFTRTVFIAVSVVFFALFGTACGQEKQGGTSSILAMKGAELDAIMNDKAEKERFFVLDVREKSEYDEGHVRYAVNISLNDLAGKLNYIDDLKDKNVVVICRSGRRSRAAAEILLKNGFKHLFNADGVAMYPYGTLTQIANVRGKQLQELAKTGKYSIVDAREQDDYNAGHLQGAISANADTVSQKAVELPKNKPVLTYCYSGNRSFAAAEQLAALGYTVINSLDGTKEYTGFALVK